MTSPHCRIKAVEFICYEHIWSHGLLQVMLSLRQEIHEEKVYQDALRNKIIPQYFLSDLGKILQLKEKASICLLVLLSKFHNIVVSINLYTSLWQ